MTPSELKKLISVARGEIPADLVLKGGQVINVFSCEIQEADVAISGDQIVGLGSYQGRETIDCRQRFICPGFIDGHLHIESTLLTPANLSPVLLPLGTTTLVADPHEIANVQGLTGIKFMLDNSAGLPLEIYFMAPSCVPATPLETSGAVLTAKELRPLRHHPRILGLAEMMNFPGVLSKDDQVLKKLSAFQHKIIDGHAPLLSGKDLCAYLTAGIRSDHECTRLSEAREKLALGMVVMIREDTQEENLKDLLPLVTPENARRCLLVTDDRPPEQLAKEGHLNAVLKQAVNLGLDPIRAIQLVTLNTAEYFGLGHLGAVAPGYQADIAVLNSLSDLTVDSVFKKGKLVAEQGRFLGKRSRPVGSKSLSGMNIKNLQAGRFRIPMGGAWARVIQLVPDQILTRAVRHKVQGKDGWVSLSPKEDPVILACVERHKGTGRVGLGLVSGFGLLQGAIASSVAHDSHNIVVIGREPEEMFLAVKAVKEMQGGLVIVVKGKVKAGLPLPVAGLMSDQSLDKVIQRQKALLQAVPLTGCPLKNPFPSLSFLALPVIPELRITDHGLVDVNRFEIVPLFD
ncbi:MAG: adenine deaminase [Deltaproteobacteria bacterium]|nr:adenine deaminase [Deltaproteobacteria bacterium]